MHMKASKVSVSRSSGRCARLARWSRYAVECSFMHVVALHAATRPTLTASCPRWWVSCHGAFRRVVRL